MTWSRSQASAGRVHHGNTQVRSRSVAWAASRSGTWYWSTCEVLAQVDHRPHRHDGAGGAAPGADLVGVDERAGVRHPGQVQPRVGRGVGCRDRVARRGARAAPPGDPEPGPEWLGRSVSRSSGELVPGHLPERLRSGARPATRWSRGRPTGRHRPRGRCRGPGRRRGRPRPRTHTVPSKDTWPVCTCACRPSSAASRRRRASAGMNRTIASSTSRSTPLGRIRCANGATWSSTNPAAAGLESPMVCAGDPPGPPRRQVPGPDPGPGAREPVPQLEGLAEVGLAGLGGQPDRGRELRHTELRDQRGARSGDRDRGVAEADRVVDRLRRVQVRPGARRGEQVGLGGVRGGPVGRGRTPSTAAAVSAAVSRVVVPEVMASF